MDVIGRHMFRQTASAMAMILVTLTLVVWMATALRQLDLVTSQGQSFVVFLQITLLALPNLISLVAPVALLISCMHILNRMNNDSEIIILAAAGGNIWRVMRPFLMLGVLVSVFVIVAVVYLNPHSLRLLRAFVVEVRTDLISQVIQPGNFVSPETGLTFHIRDRDTNGELVGLMVNDERDETQVITYLAERGRVVRQGDRSLLIMQGGQIQRVDAKREDVQLVAFESYIFDISELGARTGDIRYEPKERYIWELWSPDPEDPEYKRRPGKFTAELHDRIAAPLYPILFALIAAASLGFARTTRQGRLGTLAGAYIAAVLVRGGGLAAVNMAAKTPAAIVLIYAIPIGAIAIALFVAHRNMRPNAGAGFDITWPQWLTSRLARQKPGASRPARV
jgi:lipopolysaccharide export system permease protein